MSQLIESKQITINQSSHMHRQKITIKTSMQYSLDTNYKPSCIHLKESWYTPYVKLKKRKTWGWTKMVLSIHSPGEQAFC